MRIEFDPTNPDEAAAVRAMLTAMHPQEERRFATWLTDKLENLNDEDMNTHGPVGDEPEELERVEEEVKEMLAVPDLDSNGEPWDARIHSTPAKTNADGTWRAKRGVKAEEIAAVRAEREQTEVDVTGMMGDDTENTMSAPAQEQSAPNAPAQGQSAPPAPPAPTGQSASPEPVASTPNVATPSPAPSFLDVMKAITAAQKDGKIDTAKVKELCAAVGAGESTMGLNGPDNGDKRGAFMALLGEVVS